AGRRVLHGEGPRLGQVDAGGGDGHRTAGAVAQCSERDGRALAGLNLRGGDRDGDPRGHAGGKMQRLGGADHFRARDLELNRHPGQDDQFHAVRTGEEEVPGGRRVLDGDQVRHGGDVSRRIGRNGGQRVEPVREGGRVPRLVVRGKT